MKIEKTAIVGMGALGMMYAELIQKSQGRDHVYFVMDSERYNRSKDQEYTVNGKRVDFCLINAAEARPVDLVIVATKYNGLIQALDVMEHLVGEETIILSVLNGISSEEIIAERFGEKHILGCVAIGMDAMRDKRSLLYTKMGKLQIGVLNEQQYPLLEAVKRFFESTGLPYSVEEDIRHALWRKFLINVGINQACMVYETTYEGALKTPDVFSAMTSAMYEVIAIAKKEGVNLSEQDYDVGIKILQTLNPEGYPSMRQDALAKRPSEVELFAGTVKRIAARHQVPVPVNTYFYERIKAMETTY